MPTLSTMHLSHWVKSLEAHYQIISSCLWNHKKALYYFFFTNAQVLPKTSKHKFMCKNGEDNSFPTYTLVTQETEYLWGYLWVNSCVYKYFWLSLYPLIYGWSLHDSATVLTHTHAHTPRVCLHKSTVILHTVSQKDHINRSLIALISNS